LDSLGALNVEIKDPELAVRPYDKNRKGTV
jgi:3-oxoacyl-(acyl-carrier-protein) synthase